MKKTGIIVLILLTTIITLAAQTAGLMVLPNGNVGIGTRTPEYTLDVDGTVGMKYFKPQNVSAAYEFVRFGKQDEYWAGFMNNISSETYGDGNDFSIFTYNNRDITFRTGTGNVIIFPSSGGNVGIGRKNPQAKLDIDPTESGAGGWMKAIHFSDNAHAAITTSNLLFGMHVINKKFYFADINGSTFNKYLMTIDGTTGNVGIGITNPTKKLEVNGEIRCVWAWYTSDKRFKKNIKKIDVALPKILKLEAFSYNWRKDEFPEMGFNLDTQIGLIAQDVEKIVPEAVTTDSEGFKYINYQSFTVLLIEAVKELKAEKDAEIDELKVEKDVEINELKAELKEIRKLLKAK